MRFLCSVVLGLWGLGANFGLFAQELEIHSVQNLFSDTSEELHFPFMHVGHNRDWFLTYRRGKHGVPGGDRVTYAVSTDQGATWRPWKGMPTESPELRPKKENGDSWVRFFRFKRSDEMLLSHRYLMENVRPNQQEKQTFDWDGYLLLSEDDGAHWKIQKAIVTQLPFAKSAAFWGHFVETKSGKLLAGVYGANQQGPPFYNGIVGSTDGGVHWKFLSTIGQGLGTEGPNELDLAWLPNGDLLSVFRTGSSSSRKPSNELCYAVSADEGETWSKPGPLPETHGSVSPQLLRMGEFVVLVHGQGRKQILGRVTKDGKTWTKPTVLFEGVGSSYADLQPITKELFQMVHEESVFLNLPTNPSQRPKENRLIRTVVKLHLPTEANPK